MHLKPETPNNKKEKMNPKFLLLIIPFILFVLGTFEFLRATFRGVQPYTLMKAFGLIFAGIITLIFIIASRARIRGGCS